MTTLGGIGGTAMSVFTSWLFWLLIGILVLGVSVGSLAVRKRAKFHFPAIIFTDNGNGKVGVRFSRAGWFKSKKIFGGLIDYSGERRLEVKDGRIVQNGSSADFHEVGFKTALLLQEKSSDPKILVPIDRVQLDDAGKKVLLSIAPADYRDASSKIISDAERENADRMTQLIQIAVFGLLGVILFVSIILTIQYSKNTLAEAQLIHKEALAFYERTLDRLSAQPSPVAP